MAANTAVVSRSLDLTSNWKMQNAKMVQILNTVTDRYHRSTRLQGPRPPLGKRHYKTRKKDIFSTSCFLLPTSKRQGTSRSGTGLCTRYNSVFRLQNRVWPSLPRANRQQHSQTWSPALGIKISLISPVNETGHCGVEKSLIENRGENFKRPFLNYSARFSHLIKLRGIEHFTGFALI